MFANILIHFLKINTQITYLFDEIKLYNQFWSRYLTIYFVTYVNFITYIIYSLFFISGEFVHKIIYLFLFVYYIVAFSLVIYQCATIIRLNEKFDKLNVKCAYGFQRRFGRYHSSSQSIRYLIQVRMYILLTMLILNALIYFSLTI